jgi:hypothetical protein
MEFVNVSFLYAIPSALPYEKKSTTFSFVKKRKKLSFIEQCSYYVLGRFLALDVSLKTSQQACRFSWFPSVSAANSSKIP